MKLKEFLEQNCSTIIYAKKGIKIAIPEGAKVTAASLNSNGGDNFSVYVHAQTSTWSHGCAHFGYDNHDDALQDYLFVKTLFMDKPVVEQV